MGVAYLNNPDIFSSDEADDDSYVSTKITRYPVISGEITHYYNTTGQVISGMSELYVEEIMLEGVTDDNLTLYKSKGDEISSGEALYSFKQKDVTVDFDGKLLDISYEADSENSSSSLSNVTITVLNYDKLYIVAYIDEDKYEKIDYNTQVTVTCGTKEYEASVKNIGYEIENNQFSVEINMPTQILPGTEVSLSFVLEVEEKGLYVPKDALYNDGEGYYAYVQNGDSTEYAEITTGEEFTVEEDGTTFEYVEILSGISEDDILVMETIDNSDEDIKESLEDD